MKHYFIILLLILSLGTATKAQTFILANDSIAVCHAAIMDTIDLKYIINDSNLTTYRVVGDNQSVAFLNINVFQPLRSDSLIKIPIPLGTPAGVYKGTIWARDGNDSASANITINLTKFLSGTIKNINTVGCLSSLSFDIDNLSVATGGSEDNIIYRWMLNNDSVLGNLTEIRQADTFIHTAGTYEFIRQAKDGFCSNDWETSTGRFQIQVYDAFFPGSILGSDTVCYGDAVYIASKADASGGDEVNITYRWERNGIDIGITTEDYTILSCTTDGTFKYVRYAMDNMCATTEIPSDTFTLKVYKDFDAGGIVDYGDTICMSEFSYVDVLNENIAIGGDSIISYRWLMNGNPIDSGTNSSFKVYPYTIGNTSGTYVFEREAKDSRCSGGWQPSNNSYTLTIYANFDAGGISGNSTVCHQGTVSIASNADASGGDGKIIYLWTKEYQNNIDTIQGAESSTYTTISSNESGIFVYERLAKDSTCQTDWVSSGTYTLIIHEPLDAGSISRNNDTVCYQDDVNFIDDYNPVSGGDGNYSYKWTKNNSDIGGATSKTYTPLSNQSGTFVYKRYVGNACATGWVLSKDSSIVTVHEEFNAGSIAIANQEVCKNAQAATIANLSPASGGDGIISYLWLSNSDTVAIYTQDPFYIPATDSSGTFVYTRYAKDSICSSGWKQSSGVQVVIVNPSASIPSKPVGDTSICQGAAPESYSVNADNELFRYDWDLFPASAGTLINNQNTVSIIWEKDFFGTVYLSARAFTSCDTSAFSDTLAIMVHQKPNVTVYAVNPVCANGQGTVYSATSLINHAYLWTVDSLYATIVSNVTNPSIIIDWKKEISGTTPLFLEVVNNTTTCRFDTTISIQISQGVTPDANDIVAKTDLSGMPYVLIYPNPVGEMTYQWYRNDTAIVGATRQFYYPNHASLENSITLGAKYNVYVMYANNNVCGSFSEDYTAKKGKSTGDAFHLSPNPTRGYVNITFIEGNMDISQINLSIYSAEGRLVYQEQLYDEISIERYIPASSGVYIVKAIDNNGKEFTQKLVIQ
jgi:hypothetical protein